MLSRVARVAKRHHSYVSDCRAKSNEFTTRAAVKRATTNDLDQGVGEDRVGTGAG